MEYRLGLDVGTASLGAAAIALSPAKEPLHLAAHAVHIFNEPLENSTAGLKSKKAARRMARQQRKQIDRRASRLRGIAALAPLLGLARETLAPDSGKNLPRLRALAARERIELADLMRIFLRLAKRRGYAGEFRAKQEGAKLGEVEGGSRDLERDMRALAAEQGLDKVTLGEYLYYRHQQGLPTKLKIAEKRDNPLEISNLYALRRQAQSEFDQIWDAQTRYHDILSAKHKDGQPFKAMFQEAIFRQRPLKPARGMVGQCSLEPTLPRAPRAQPAFQRFRIEKTLADLRWGAGKRALPLSAAQKELIRRLLDQKETVLFKTILTALEKAGCPQPDGRGLNLDRASREELKGDKTNAVFRQLGLATEWAALDERTQIQTINFLADLGSPEQLDDPQWHTRFARADGLPRSFGQEMVAFIDRLKDNDKFDRLAKMGFDGGRASYSVKALNKLSEWLADPWWPEGWQGEMRVDEEAAIRVCYPESQLKPSAALPRLPLPRPTGDAVVDGALRQIRYVVNGLIDRLGAPPTEIVVEMAREMGIGITRRNERESAMNKNRKARVEAENAIRAANASVTPSRVRRYLLWKEQGEKFCPYCERTINLEHALSGAETEYEHILPRSLTQVGFKRSEIVLAHRGCNQAKSNRTPWDAWGEGRDPARWNVVEQRAAWFEKNKRLRKAKLLLLKDFEQEVLNDESIAAFSDRQFHQTSWIAKEAALWLQRICPTPVAVSRGELTATLRRGWRLETVIPESRLAEGLPVLDDEGRVVTPEEFERFKPVWEGHRAPSRELHTDRKLDKRIDHRHHLIDAITIALTSRSLFQEMARTYKAESERCNGGERPRLHPPEPPLRNVREHALTAVRECNLTIKPDRYPDGAIFQATAYGVAQKDGDEKSRLTLRMAVAELIDRRKGTVEQARKAIAAIVSDTTRMIVSQAFEARIAQGKNAPEALAEPFYQDCYGQRIPIKKVRCHTDKYAEDAPIVEHADRRGVIHRKRLLHAGYAYLECELKEGRVIRSDLVPTLRAMKDKGRPHPPNTIRLHKGDTVLDQKDGKEYRVGYFKAEGKIFLVPLVEPRAYDVVKEPSSGKKIVSFSQTGRLRIVG